MFTAISFGMLGLIVGSFLNVLVLRWGERALTGRSICSSCGKQIAWYDLVPVVSWLALLGRCRMCSTRISIQYPLVEITTAMTFALIGAAPLVFGLKVLSLPIAALLVAILVYDLYHTLIPDAWVYSFVVLAFISQFLIPFSGEFDPWWFIFSGPVVALPLFALWFLSRGAWMGFGDVKLALGMGWLLGPYYGIVSIFFAFVLGALVSVPLLFFSSVFWRRIRERFTPTIPFTSLSFGFTMKSEVPFGPFLIASCLLIWFTQMFGFTLPLPFT